MRFFACCRWRQQYRYGQRNRSAGQQPRPITNYQGVEKVKNEIPPLIVLPTTAGTGSEVSFVAAIIDTQNKFKMVIKSSLLAPKIALIDPTLYTTAPLKVIASTGMDAFTHAIEAYTFCRTLLEKSHSCRGDMVRNFRRNACSGVLCRNIPQILVDGF